MVGGSTGFTAAVGAGLVHFFMKCLSEVLAPRCFLKKEYNGFIFYVWFGWGTVFALLSTLFYLNL